MSASKNSKVIRRSDSSILNASRPYYDVNRLVGRVYRLIKSKVGDIPIIRTLSAELGQNF